MNTTTGARFDILHDGEEAAERSLESAVMSACGTVSGITDQLIDDITPTGFETPTFISNEVKDAYIEVTERLMTDMFHEGRLAIPGSRKADVEALITSGEEDIFSVRDALQSADDKFHLYSPPGHRRRRHAWIYRPAVEGRAVALKMTGGCPIEVFVRPNLIVIVS